MPSRLILRLRAELIRLLLLSRFRLRLRYHKQMCRSPLEYERDWTYCFPWHPVCLGSTALKQRLSSLWAYFKWLAKHLRGAASKHCSHRLQPRSSPEEHPDQLRLRLGVHQFRSTWRGYNRSGFHLLQLPSCYYDRHKHLRRVVPRLVIDYQESQRPIFLRKEECVDP